MAFLETKSEAEQTRIRALNIALTYGSMIQYSEFIAFFSNKANTQAIYDAFLAYGLPPMNTNWKNGFWKFYCAAKLFNLYPALNLTDKNNCKKLKEISEALDLAKLNVDKEHLGTGANSSDDGTLDKLAVINDYQSKINAAYAGLSCATVVLKEQKEETLTDLKKATEETTAETTNSSSSKAITYIAILLVVVIIIKIFKS